MKDGAPVPSEAEMFSGITDNNKIVTVSRENTFYNNITPVPTVEPLQALILFLL